ncbi:MAG: ribonuclease P protein component [Alphaproteobacteria bacterium]|nr:ribonuclease P protein component [Alphaproteobacteria bacterium]MCL2504708.1 ribonuclease P protein component [Alphaproteobacteria bacterium]
MTARLESLRRRADFIDISNSGKRWVSKYFILQIRENQEPVNDSSVVRYGITATKKIGNAVVRNRSKRRLRVLAREFVSKLNPQHDYVFVARTETPSCEFSDMKTEIQKAIKRLKI